MKMVRDLFFFHIENSKIKKNERFPLGNGELSKDEFYSLSLRLNIFPRFHRYFKETNGISPLDQRRISDT